jgi:hypothetical protein
VRNKPVTDTANSPARAQPAAQEDEDARQHQHRRDVERVVDDPAHDAPGVELEGADPRHEHLVPVTLLIDALEVQQAQRQGERHQCGQDAAPEDELMGQPPRAGSVADEALREQMGDDERRKGEQIAAPVLAEGIPTSAVQHRGRWSAQPHRVAVEDAEHHEDDPEQVADQRGIEPQQALAAEEGDGERDGDADQTPGQPSPVEGGVTDRRTHPGDGTRHRRALRSDEVADG